MKAIHGGVAGAGARVLSEVEETSLDEILASLRTGFAASTTENHHPPTSSLANPNLDSSFPVARRTFAFPALNDLVARHHRATGSAPLALTGRALELAYVLVATLIAPPFNMAVSVIDFDDRFDVLRLLAARPEGDAAPRHLSRADLDHVHVARPGADGAARVKDCVQAMEEYMLYAGHGSRGREWWGTVVVGRGVEAKLAKGEAGDSVAVVADWSGWMRVEKMDVKGFGDMSVEEALALRATRDHEVEAAGWVGRSAWWAFWFGDGEGG